MYRGCIYMTSELHTMQRFRFSSVLISAIVATVIFFTTYSHSKTEECDARLVRFGFGQRDLNHPFLTRDKSKEIPGNPGTERIRKNVFATFTDRSLKKTLEIEEAAAPDKDVVIKYTSPFCSHCLHILPTFLGLSSKRPDTSFIIADVGMMTKSIRAVQNLPTVEIRRNGRPVDRFLAKSPQALLDHMWLWSDRKKSKANKVDDERRTPS
eukprot:jgi/Bigna1/86570/estExt_fgenesh1_pg.C_110240